MDQAPYTVLLVGEIGVVKSSLLEFIANVLIARDIDHYDFEILDPTHEQGVSDNQSRTSSARLYELRSNNGIMVSATVSDDRAQPPKVRILGTSGLADTCGTQQHGFHKSIIVTQIKEHIDSYTAILVFVLASAIRALSVHHRPQVSGQ